MRIVRSGSEFRFHGIQKFHPSPVRDEKVRKKKNYFDVFDALGRQSAHFSKNHVFWGEKTYNRAQTVRKCSDWNSEHQAAAAGLKPLAAACPFQLWCRNCRWQSKSAPGTGLCWSSPSLYTQRGLEENKLASRRQLPLMETKVT